MTHLQSADLAARKAEARLLTERQWEQQVAALANHTCSTLQVPYKEGGSYGGRTPGVHLKFVEERGSLPTDNNNLLHGLAHVLGLLGRTELIYRM